MSEDSVCPSCGLKKGDKELNKPLCHFCYFRGLANSAKMVYLGIMLGGGTQIKKFTAEELVAEFNKLGFGDTKLSTVKKYLVNYKNLHYVAGSSIRVANRGRPKKIYRITEKGIRILKEYLSKWKLGQSLLLKQKHKKWKASRDDNERSAAIRGKMQKPEYKKDCLQFLMTQRRSSKPQVSPLHL
jgi:DNA-binding PadR family transcriptional regulator